MSASFTSQGIIYAATQSQSSDANTLDDYEEGTWAATITTTNTDFTTSGRATGAIYTKIGQQVMTNAAPSINSPSSGSGNITLTGFPFAPVEGVVSAGLYLGRFDLSGDFGYHALINADTTQCSFYFQNNNANPTTMAAAQINGNSTPYLSVNFVYRTAG
jgi:hypothetical protein